jgi:ABC-type Fe3+ transport system substrate-binding protein
MQAKKYAYKVLMGNPSERDYLKEPVAMLGYKNGWDSTGHVCTKFSKNLKVTLKL